MTKTNDAPGDPMLGGFAYLEKIKDNPYWPATQERCKMTTNDSSGMVAALSCLIFLLIVGCVLSIAVAGMIAQAIARCV